MKEVSDIIVGAILVGCFISLGVCIYQLAWGIT